MIFSQTRRRLEATGTIKNVLNFDVISVLLSVIEKLTIFLADERRLETTGTNKRDW